MLMSRVILVDENDIPLGTAEKLIAHQKAQLHRAFSVFIYRYTQQQIEILLQKRHAAKYHSGGLWTNTCCSHPMPGEKTLVAAQRRLQEEMGIQATLKEVGVFHYTANVGKNLIENEIDHVFVGEMSHQEIKIDPEEISEYAWMKISDSQEDLQQHPEKYTAWLGQALRVC